MKANLQLPMSMKDVVILKQGCGYIKKDVGMYVSVNKTLQIPYHIPPPSLPAILYFVEYAYGR